MGGGRRARNVKRSAWPMKGFSCIPNLSVFAVDLMTSHKYGFVWGQSKRLPASTRAMISKYDQEQKILIESSTFLDPTGALGRQF